MAIQEYILYKLVDPQGAVKRVGECIAQRETGRKREHKRKLPPHTFVVFKRGIVDDDKTKDRIRTLEAMYKRFYATRVARGGWNLHENKEEYITNCQENGRIQGKINGPINGAKMEYAVRVKSTAKMNEHKNTVTNRVAVGKKVMTPDVAREYNVKAQISKAVRDHERCPTKSTTIRINSLKDKYPHHFPL